MTFIAALRLDRISAPWIIDGPINGEFFTIYAEQVLAPTLAKGDIVILTISAATKPRQRATPSVPEAPILSSCRPTAPISIRSNSSLPSSNISCETPSRATSTQPGERSENSSTSSRQANAQTTSETQAMFPSKRNLL